MTFPIPRTPWSRALGCALLLAAAPAVHAAGDAADTAIYPVGVGNHDGLDGGTGFNTFTGTSTGGINDASTFRVTPGGGATSTFAGSLAAAHVSQFQVFNHDAAGGPGSDPFSEGINVTAVPEPSTLVTAIGALVLGLLMWPRLRRSA